MVAGPVAAEGDAGSAFTNRTILGKCFTFLNINFPTLRTTDVMKMMGAMIRPWQGSSEVGH